MVGSTSGSKHKKEKKGSILGGGGGGSKKDKKLKKKKHDSKTYQPEDESFTEINSSFLSSGGFSDFELQGGENDKDKAIMLQQNDHSGDLNNQMGKMVEASSEKEVNVSKSSSDKKNKKRKDKERQKREEKDRKKLDKERKKKEKKESEKARKKSEKNQKEARGELIGVGEDVGDDDNNNSNKDDSTSLHSISSPSSPSLRGGNLVTRAASLFIKTTEKRNSNSNNKKTNDSNGSLLTKTNTKKNNNNLGAWMKSQVETSTGDDASCAASVQSDSYSVLFGQMKDSEFDTTEDVLSVWGVTLDSDEEDEPGQENKKDVFSSSSLSPSTSSPITPDIATSSQCDKTEVVAQELPEASIRAADSSEEESDDLKASAKKSNNNKTNDGNGSLLAKAKTKKNNNNLGAWMKSQVETSTGDDASCAASVQSDSYSVLFGQMKDSEFDTMEDVLSVWGVTLDSGEEDEPSRENTKVAQGLPEATVRSDFSDELDVGTTTASKPSRRQREHSTKSSRSLSPTQDRKKNDEKKRRSTRSLSPNPSSSGKGVRKKHGSSRSLRQSTKNLSPGGDCNPSDRLRSRSSSIKRLGDATSNDTNSIARVHRRTAKGENNQRKDREKEARRLSRKHGKKQKKQEDDQQRPSFTKRMSKGFAELFQMVNSSNNADADNKKNNADADNKEKPIKPNKKKQEIDDNDDDDDDDEKRPSFIRRASNGFAGLFQM